MATQHVPPAPLCDECGVPAPGGVFRNTAASSGDTVCPVCSMGVKQSSGTPYVQYKGGQRLLFCCHACMETFESNNRDYIEKHDVAAK